MNRDRTSRYAYKLDGGKSRTGVGIPPGELNALRSVEVLAGDRKVATMCLVRTPSIRDPSMTAPSGYAISGLENTEQECDRPPVTSD